MWPLFVNVVRDICCKVSELKEVKAAVFFIIWRESVVFLEEVADDYRWIGHRVAALERPVDLTDFKAATSIKVVLLPVVLEINGSDAKCRLTALCRHGTVILRLGLRTR